MIFNKEMVEKKIRFILASIIFWEGGRRNMLNFDANFEIFSLKQIDWFIGN